MMGGGVSQLGSTMMDFGSILSGYVIHINIFDLTYF